MKGNMTLNGVSLDNSVSAKKRLVENLNPDVISYGMFLDICVSPIKEEEKKIQQPSIFNRLDNLQMLLIQQK
jgi:hypothetical protein